jgi:hypothetical protein
MGGQIAGDKWRSGAVESMAMDANKPPKTRIEELTEILKKTRLQEYLAANMPT